MTITDPTITHNRGVVTVGSTQLLGSTQAWIVLSAGRRSVTQYACR
jgi:hypothetical protein